MADDTSGGALSTARVAVKSIAIAIGAVGTLFSLMSLVGLVLADGWARFGIAIVVTIAVPALLSDRLLPDDDPTRAKGLPGDVSRCSGSASRWCSPSAWAA